MSVIIQTTNEGPLITASNFWQSEAARRGFLYLSINAGAFRLLVPSSRRTAIRDMRQGARHVVISMLSRELWRDGAYCVEWLVEDGSSSPWSCQLSAGQIDRAPGPADVGIQWRASVWEESAGRPHQCMELPAYFQIVPRLPWLKKIDG